jgi:hypothetical protein
LAYDLAHSSPLLDEIKLTVVSHNSVDGTRAADLAP